MSEFIVEIHSKNRDLDPLAKHVKGELLEAGVPKDKAEVETRRLFKIQANVSVESISSAAQTLLVDPVVETAELVELDSPKNSKKKTAKAKTKGVIVDIWPKKGVTDPVGETVQKGLRDLGFPDGVLASSAQRYVFPKIKEPTAVKTLVKRYLANELIHDIHIHN